jgi:hypothetical protein
MMPAPKQFASGKVGLGFAGTTVLVIVCAAFAPFG